MGFVKGVALIKGAVNFESVTRTPVAPVVTVSSKPSGEINARFESLLSCCEVDGFLLHPKVFTTGYLYTPCKHGQAEAVPTMSSAKEYDDLVSEGCVTFMLRKHQELGLIRDLEREIENVKVELGSFADKWEKGEGVAVYCGSLAIAPFGFVAYQRGLIEALKDVRRCPELVKEACFKIAEELADYTAEVAKEVGVSRIWISLAYSTPDTLGDYFVEFSWLPLKVMVQRYVSSGVTPILQFDTDIQEILSKFGELPRRKCILHFNVSTDVRVAREALRGCQCVAGNVPLDGSLPVNQVAARCKEILEKCRGTGFILSTDGSSPLVVAEKCPPSLKAFIEAGRRYG